MSKTGQELLTGLSKYLNDYWASTTTSAGDTDNLIDTALGRYRDDALIERFFRITETGHTAIWEVRRCWDFQSSTGDAALRPAFSAAVGSGTDYEMHRWEPQDKFFALDEAKNRVFPDMHVLRLVDTITGDGHTRVFDVPSTIRSGPVFAQVETPVSADVNWNFLADPEGDSTSAYTASNTTAATVSRTDADDIVPKYGDTETTLTTAASTAATYTLAVASAANGLTAASARDREMTFARYVYCTEASKVRLGITDDSGTSYGAFHGGSGWELLTVEDTVAGNNTTLLSAVVDIASTANPSVIVLSRGWWYFGKAERVRDGLYFRSERKQVMRDDTLQQVYLDYAPPRGYQVRLVGYDSLSALGSTPASQVTATMEVDDEQSAILYAAAAEVLYKGAGYATGQLDGTALQVARQDRVEAKQAWGQQARPSPLRSPWSR